MLHERLVAAFGLLALAAFPAAAQPPAPCIDCQYATGSLSSKRAEHIQPTSGSYVTVTSGLHEGWLRGPASSDFALRLERRDGSQWRTVAKGDVSGSSTESLSHNGVAATYRWVISAKRAGGAYELWSKSTPVQSPVDTPTGSGSWTSASAGQNHSCGVTSTGLGYCWGANQVGELGIGTIGGKSVPTAVAGGILWSHIDGGDDFTCGLATSGSAYCWGYAWHGQLGDGVLAGDYSTIPKMVVGGLQFSMIDAGTSGNYHACGITTAGAAYCWGNNTYGQLGNGAITNPFGSAEPVPVLGGHSFTEISVGRDFTCGITAPGALYCWGDNEVGQLGDGNGAPGLMTPYPVAVAGGQTWKAVTTADSHACGVTTAGQMFCWGQDIFGELGRGVAGASSNVPVPVASGVTFQAAGAGSYHTCAISTAGAAYCWGYNEFGTLGRGTKGSVSPNPTPEPVLGGITFAPTVQGGYLQTCAAALDGNVYCWGFDGSGELGIEPDGEFCAVPGGQASCRSTPSRVSSPR